MKYLKHFLVFLVFTFTFAGLVQSVDARGADEPCSYLNPTKYVRDSGGNCVIASSGSTAGVSQSGIPQTGVSQARSISEPCSYLSPTKYIRDPSGNCVINTQNSVPQVVPSTPSVPMPPTTETFVTPQFQSSTWVPSAGDSGMLSTFLMILGIAAIGIILSKKLKGRKRTARSKWSITPSLSDDLPVDGWREVRDFENRFQNMRDEDPDQILVDAGATLKNFSKKGNELYETRRIIRNRVLNILKYVDPSTGRIYISFVPDHINDADEAMAWKFSITKQQYRDLVDQG